MQPLLQSRIRIAERVTRSLSNGEPVVALESTVIAHGLPAPLNIQTARDCEAAIRNQGATAATVGIVQGAPSIGLTDEELEMFAQAAGEINIEKAGLNSLAGIMLKRGWGATTVAASLRIACAGGIKVFSTGGIGGVHRGVAASFDISADLTALAQTPLLCVCAGAKAILDLPKTVELLETLGVPIAGYCTSEFPAFYSRTSGLPVDVTVETPEEAAELAAIHWESGGPGAVLICVPIPEESEIPFDEIERATDQALEIAGKQGVSRKGVTPFVLSQIEKITGGRSLMANHALLVNNAELAARVAVCLSRRTAQGTHWT